VILTGFDRIAVLPAGDASGSLRLAAAAAICAFRRSCSVVTTAPARGERAAR